MRELEEVLGGVAEESERVTSRCHALRQEDDDLRLALTQAQQQRTEALMRTAKMQRQAKRYEDALSGRFRPPSSAGRGGVAGAMQAEQEQKRRLMQALVALRQNNPDLEGIFGRLVSQLTV